MPMNWKQKAFLIGGLVLILATGLYPPWIQSWSFVAEGEELTLRVGPGAEGYSWIFRPPGAPEWVDRSFKTPDHLELKGSQAAEDGQTTGTDMKAALHSIKMSGPWRAQIDTHRLLMEWLMAAAVSLVGFVCSARRGPDARV